MAAILSSTPATPEVILQHFSQADTMKIPNDGLTTIAHDLESSEEGKAWLKASSELEKKYKHSIKIEAVDDKDSIAKVSSGAFQTSAAANGNFYSLIAYVGVQVTPSSLKKQFNAKGWAFFPAIPGFLA